jgi:hypothetical protein
VAGDLAGDVDRGVRGTDGQHHVALAHERGHRVDVFEARRGGAPVGVFATALGGPQHARTTRSRRRAHPGPHLTRMQ